MNDLSVVVCTWHRPASMLLHSIHTLSNQTMPPREIIVVDANDKPSLTEENRKACAGYPLVRFVHTTEQRRFNLAKAMNVGIKQAQGTFIMATCMENLFSQNSVSILLDLMGAEYFGVTTCGVLPLNYQLGAIDTVHARWSDICAHIEPGSNHRISPGAILCAHHDWWNTIRGYDETYYPFSETDCDLARQARFAGLSQICMHWSLAQVIHPLHKATQNGDIQPGGEWYFSSIEDVVRNRARNPRGWGEA